MACLFGHKWNGCTCDKCGKTRDEGHSFTAVQGQCKERCSVCGKEVSVDHDFAITEGGETMRCKACGHVSCVEHDWAYGASTEEKKTCQRCGLTEKMYLDESMGVKDYDEAVAADPSFASEKGAIPILGSLSMLKVLALSYYSKGYNLPFESVWSGNYQQGELDKYLEGKVFNASSKEQAAQMLGLQLTSFARVKNGLEKYPNIVYYYVVKQFAPSEEADALHREAPSLSAEQKLEKGKALFRHYYENQHAL